VSFKKKKNALKAKSLERHHVKKITRNKHSMVSLYLDINTV